MNVKICYPKTNSRMFIVYKARKVSLVLLSLAVIVCGIVNWAIGGKPWILYVFGGALLFWVIFLNWPLVEDTPLQKMTEIVVTATMYLIVIDLLGDASWYQKVAPTMIFSLVILLSVIYYLDYRNKRRNFLPLMWLILASFVAIILAFAGIGQMNWQTIVLGAVALVSAVVAVSAYGRPILNELKKRFHVE